MQPRIRLFYITTVAQTRPRGVRHARASDSFHWRCSWVGKGLVVRRAAAAVIDSGKKRIYVPLPENSSLLSGQTVHVSQSGQLYFACTTSVRFCSLSLITMATSPAGCKCALLCLFVGTVALAATVCPASFSANRCTHGQRPRGMPCSYRCWGVQFREELSICCRSGSDGQLWLRCVVSDAGRGLRSSRGREVDKTRGIRGGAPSLLPFTYHLPTTL